MILTVTLNPCIDKTVFVERHEIGRIIRAHSVKCIAGGKGVNVARVLKNLGADVLAFVLLGGHTGRIIRELAEQDGIEIHPLWISEPSRTVTTVLETSTGIQTAYVEPGPSVSKEEREKVWDELRRLIPRSEIVILSGSSPCPELDELYREAIALAGEMGVMAILDSRGRALNFGLEATPFMVKPNAAETREILGFSPEDRKSRIKALRMYAEMGVELTVLSLGREGAWVWWRGEIYEVKPPPVKEVNPVGSGDSMVAGMAYGLIAGMDLGDVLRLGVAAGAANAAMWDAASCTKDQIESIINGVQIRRL
jgi:1-phosphofructokinase family hexose kinase